MFITILAEMTTIMEKKRAMGMITDTAMDIRTVTKETSTSVRPIATP